MMVSKPYLSFLRNKHSDPRANSKSENRVNMKTKIILLLVAIGSINMACKKKTAETAATETSEESSEIQLNNGEKWTAPASMVAYIDKMQKDLDSASTVEQRDYAALTTQLDADVKQLISNCTMTGKSHDELHKWLLPYMELIKDISSTDQKQADEAFEKAKSSVKEFYQYFAKE